MKLFASVLMVLLATPLLSGCGDGPCDAGFSFKYCLNQNSSGSSSSAQTRLSLGGVVSGLGSGKTVKLTLSKNITPAMDNSVAGVSVDPNSSSFTTSDNSGNEYTAGWSFSVAGNRVVTHLGVWSGGGLYGNVDLGLWDGSGNLLSSISLLTANIASYGLENEFSYAVLPTSVLLTAGQTYTLGGFYKGGVLAGYGAPVTPSTGLSYVAPSLVDFGTALARPTTDFSSATPNGYFGPSLRFLSSTATGGVGETITVSADGSFTFPTALFPIDTYVVSVSGQPEGQYCAITNGTGTMVATAVTNVTVTCL